MKITVNGYVYKSKGKINLTEEDALKIDMDFSNGVPKNINIPKLNCEFDEPDFQDNIFTLQKQSVKEQ